MRAQPVSLASFIPLLSTVCCNDETCNTSCAHAVVDYRTPSDTCITGNTHPRRLNRNRPDELRAGEGTVSLQLDAYADTRAVARW